MVKADLLDLLTLFLQTKEEAIKTYRKQDIFGMDSNFDDCIIQCSMMEVIKMLGMENIYTKFSQPIGNCNVHYTNTNDNIKSL